MDGWRPAMDWRELLEWAPGRPHYSPDGESYWTGVRWVPARDVLEGLPEELFAPAATGPTAPAWVQRDHWQVVIMVVGLVVAILAVWTAAYGIATGG